jgi:hypothetical protein
MKTSRPIVALGVLGLLGCAVVAGNVQYLFLSTYRVKNDSGPPVANVHLTLKSSSGTRDLGVMAAVGTNRASGGCVSEVRPA